MYARDPFVAAQIHALEDLFDDTDAIAELSDVLKDRRKEQAIADTVAMIEAYFTDDPDLMREIVSLAVDHGITFERFMASINAGTARAAEARRRRAMQ